MAGLTSLPLDPLLDLPPWVGQRQATYRFELWNGVSGEFLGEIHPLRSATLTHDTTRTIKRELSMDLGEFDTATVDPVSARIHLFMVFPGGQEWALGTYMFSDATRQVFTTGKLGAMALYDEMFLVDQQIATGISTISPNGTPINLQIRKAMDGVPVKYTMQASPYSSSQSWTMGTRRGQVLEDLALAGAMFSPWFGNDSELHFILAFDPIDAVPQFDFDAGNQVYRAGIVEQDNLLTAPNRFVVVGIGSGAAGSDQLQTPIVGEARVPQSAPHSLKNRGFEILEVTTLQAEDVGQAAAIAATLMTRQTLFETVTLTTAPDPRHDSYDVIRWQGELWLELAWSMALTEGGGMNHSMRKAYTNG